MDKVVRDGRVAVLYSPGYGAGWYSWNEDHPECLFDPEVVALVEAGENNKIEALMDKKYTRSDDLSDQYFYSGGAQNLKIQWLDEGTAFRISEYDGSERVVTSEDEDWLVA